MSKKGGCRSSGNRSHKSSSSGNRSHKSKGSGGNQSSCKSSGNRSYECKSSGNKSHECKSSGNRSYESNGNNSSRSSGGVQGVLALIGVGTPNIRIHFDGTFHTGIFLGITAGCVVVNVKGVICYIRISSITAVDVGCVEKKKRKFKCRKR